jgi:hypothetical protein
LLKCGSIVPLNNLGIAQRFATAFSINTFIMTLDMDGITASSAAVVGAVLYGLAHNTTLDNSVLGEIKEGEDLQPMMEHIAAVRGLRRLTLSEGTWSMLLQHYQSFVRPAIFQNTSLEALPGLNFHLYPQYRRENY